MKKSIDITKLTNHERYKIATGSIIPRPIALVSTISKNGIHNVAPFSFFTIASTSPLVLVFFPMNFKKDTLPKDTLANIRETGEMVIQIVSEDIAAQVNASSALFDRDIDEFKESGLTPIPSDLVKPARVEESPIQFECKLYKEVQIGSDGPGGSHAVFAEVLKMHIEEELEDNSRINVHKINPMTRLAGPYWSKMGELVEFQRPI